ncbi:MAG: cytochrome c maturation protein CcmE [Pseudomonadota bacterium]
MNVPSPYERRRRRGLFLSLIVPAFAGSVALSLFAISQTQVYAYAPSTLPPFDELAGREVRLAGLVLEGTLASDDDGIARFTVTDGVGHVPVAFEGILPALVAENDGVIAQGVLLADGLFRAKNVLARHDENYEAPEVIKALEEAQGDVR